MSPEEIDPTALAPGTHIHAYEVVSRLGQGGMGAVYKVVRDGNAYALKITAQKHSEVSASERAHTDARTRREVATLAAVNHPNVVQIRAFDRWPDSERGYLYLVTDLVEGDRIYTWQEKHKPSLRNIAGVFLHIADGLHELHRHEVYHRDIKNENVLIRNDGEPILIDFGIARQRSAYTLTTAGSIVGTTTHLSPGFCRFVTSLAGSRGERYSYQPTDDLHAVGFLLYEMVTGRPPFSLVDENEWQLLLDIANKLPPRPRQSNPELPEALDTITMRLLAKEPSQAFASGMELAAALTQALEKADGSWDAPYVPPPFRKGLAFDARGRSRKSAPSGELVALLFDGAPEGPTSAPTRAVSARGSAPGRPDTPAPPALDAAPASFRPPTEEAHGEAAPAAAPSASSPHAPAASPQLPTAIRLATTQLAVPPRASSRTVLLASLGSAAAAAVLALALGGGRPSSDAPQSLMATYRKAQEVPATPSAKAPAPAPETTAPPAERIPAPQASATPAPAAPPPAPTVVEKAPAPSRGTPRNTRASSLAPSQPAQAQAAPEATPAPAASSTSWLKTAQSISDGAAGTAAASAKLGVPFGAHIRVKLRSNLDSRTSTDALVEAVLPRPFLRRGEPLLPSRTHVYGTAQVSGERFVIRFTRLRLPDDREVAFSGKALDLSDGKPGLAPNRRISTAPAQGEDVVAKAVRSSANVLLGKVGGDTASDAAAAAGHAALNHNHAPQGASTQTLLLDAGGEFDVVVTEAF